MEADVDAALARLEHTGATITAVAVKAMVHTEAATVDVPPLVAEVIDLTPYDALIEVAA